MVFGLKRKSAQDAPPPQPRPKDDIETPFWRLDAFFDEHLFIHVHNSKAGGSALLAGLTHLVGAVNVVDTRALPAVYKSHNLGDETARRVRLYSGHHYYGAHRRFAPRRPLYVATVRPPVDRVLSYFAYLTDEPEHPGAQRIAGKDFEAAFEAVLAERPLKVSNLQAKRILGRAEADELSMEKLLRRVDEDFFLVAPSDRISETVARLHGAFGVAAPELGRVNAARSAKPELSESMRQRVEALNEADAALFEEVRSRFDRDLERAETYIRSWLSGANA